MFANGRAYGTIVGGEDSASNGKKRARKDDGDDEDEDVDSGDDDGDGGDGARQSVLDKKRAELKKKKLDKLPPAAKATVSLAESVAALVQNATSKRELLERDRAAQVERQNHLLERGLELILGKGKDKVASVSVPKGKYPVTCEVLDDWCVLFHTSSYFLSVLLWTYRPIFMTNYCAASHNMLRCRSVFPIPKGADGNPLPRPHAGYNWERTLAILQVNAVEADAVWTLTDESITEMQDANGVKIPVGILSVLKLAVRALGAHAE